MIIDNKWPLLKGFLSDFKFGSRMSKSSLQQSMVTSTEQKSVSLEMNAEDQAKDPYKKGKSQDQFSKIALNSSVEEPAQQNTLEQKTEEGKKLNLKLLNLI